MNKYRKEMFINQRQNKSGKYTFQVRVRTENGDVVKSFSEKDYGSAKLAFESAVLFRDRTMYELRNGTLLMQSNATVQDMFDTYLETTTCSFKTQKKQKYQYKKYVLHKTTKMQNLTRADIQEDLNKMAETCSKDTISKVYYIWKNCIVGTALLKDVLNKDIMLGVKKPESKAISIKKSTKTDRETLDKLKKAIISSTRDTYNARIINFLLEVLYYTGMRPAEAFALTRDDFSKNGISITKEIGSSIEDTGVVRRVKADDSVRVIPIHPELKEILEELKAYSRYDELFKDSNGKYIEIDWLDGVIYRACKSHKIQFHMYRLRHNLATQLVTNKVDSKTTIELMGHANYDMSLYYASSNDELKEEAIKYLS